MGVGVYTSDFDGTGVTFMVSPDFYCTKEDYEAYKTDVEKDGDEPLDFEEWATQEHDDFVQEVKACISGVIQAVEGRTAEVSDWRTRFPADRDFALINDGRDYEIGMRSWESDYVIGIAPSGESVRSMIANGEEYEGECQEAFGMPLEQFRARHEERLELLKEALIQNLLRADVDCRYRTSGYTTSAYELEEGDDVVASKVSAYAAAKGTPASAQAGVSPGM